ncbi:MAG: ABC transporter permease [Terriglobales bacterium]
MLLQLIRVAFDNLRSNKLRSSLTMLTVIIGVMMIVAMAAVITGLNTSVARQIASLGSNIVTVSRMPSFAFRFPTEEERQRKELTRDDAEEIRQKAQDIAIVTSRVYLDPQKFPNPDVRYGNVHASGVAILGVEPDYINVYTSYAREGRFLSDGDVRHRTNVVVLGATVAEKMFPHQDPMGRTVNFENDAFEVIGVLEKRGSMFGFDRDNFIWLPITTLLKLHPDAKDGLYIDIKTNAQAAMPAVMEQVTEILRRRRHDPPKKPNSFDVGTQNQFIEFYQSLTGGIYVVLLVISSISLVVGGIGVMNIMLVSVTERTREIGVRKAVGARKRHILVQFLLEAMVLTAIGGVIGILLAGGISLAVDAFSPLPSRVSLSWVVLAFTVALSVGLFFGIYPAARAARLDPIESLRYE